MADPRARLKRGLVEGRRQYAARPLPHQYRGVGGGLSPERNFNRWAESWPAERDRRQPPGSSWKSCGLCRELGRSAVSLQVRTRRKKGAGPGLVQRSCLLPLSACRARLQRVWGAGCSSQPWRLSNSPLLSSPAPLGNGRSPEYIRGVPGWKVRTGLPPRPPRVDFAPLNSAKPTFLFLEKLLSFRPPVSLSACRLGVPWRWRVTLPIIPGCQG